MKFMICVCILDGFPHIWIKLINGAAESRILIKQKRPTLVADRFMCTRYGDCSAIYVPVCQ
jgi:hypothetical protein